MALSAAVSACAPALSVRVSNRVQRRSYWQTGQTKQQRASLGGSMLGLRTVRLAASKARRQVAAPQPRQLRVQAEVQYLNVEDAVKAVKEEGYTVLDIRDKAQYDRSYISGSVHIPLFVENTDTDIGTLIKKQVHTSFVGVLYGLAFTKPNEQFLSMVAEKFPKDSKLLVVCQEGLRSGSAVEGLDNAGFENVALLTSGLQAVPPGTFPKEGPRELKEAGKAGFVTIQTQFSVVLATIILVAYLYLEFFPEESTELLKKFTPPS